jgi:hypothetical protein
MTIDQNQIRDSIESGIQRLSTSVDQHVRSLVDELWQATQREREEAVAAVEARVAAESETSAADGEELERLRGELDATQTDL